MTNVNCGIILDEQVEQVRRVAEDQAARRADDIRQEAGLHLY